MPISPVASSVVPAPAWRAARAAPVRTACSAWARLMAGPAVMSPVPLPTRQDSTPSVGAKSKMPMSTGTTRHRAAWGHPADGALARRQPPGHRRRCLGAGLGHPLGHHPVVGAEDQHRPAAEIQLCAAVRAAASSSMVSSRPRLPRGWASEAQRRWAASRAAWSAGYGCRPAQGGDGIKCLHDGVPFDTLRRPGQTGRPAPACPPSTDGGRPRTAPGMQNRTARPGRRACRQPGPSRGRWCPSGGTHGGDGLPFAEEQAVLLRRQGGVAEADQPPGRKALPRQNAGHRPAWPSSSARARPR